MGEPTIGDMMEPAWAAFVQWAFGNPDFRAQFEAETRNRYSPPTHELEAMIDDATGRVDAYAEAFMFWVTEAHWGIEEAPTKVQAALANRSTDND